MKKYLNILVSSILAGIFIGIGCAINLSIRATSPILGAVFFGIGLFLICSFGLFLYTGKVGFVLDNKPNFFIDLLVGIFGNVIGIVSFAKTLLLTRVGDSLSKTALTLVEAKQNDSWYSILVLSIMCGFMIYLAVKGFKEIESGFGKTVCVFLAVAVFILCGYEHSIANMGYYAFARVADFKVFGYFLLMILGNGIGSVILDGLFKLLKKTK